MWTNGQTERLRLLEHSGCTEYDSLRSCNGRRPVSLDSTYVEHQRSEETLRKQHLEVETKPKAFERPYSVNSGVPRPSNTRIHQFRDFKAVERPYSVNAGVPRPSNARIRQFRDSKAVEHPNTVNSGVLRPSNARIQSMQGFPSVSQALTTYCTYFLWSTAPVLNEVF
jgi:hypothetical protein